MGFRINSNSDNSHTDFVYLYSNTCFPKPLPSPNLIANFFLLNPESMRNDKLLVNSSYENNFKGIRLGP